VRHAKLAFTTFLTASLAIVHQLPFVSTMENVSAFKTLKAKSAIVVCRIIMALNRATVACLAIVVWLRIARNATIILAFVLVNQALEVDNATDVSGDSTITAPMDAFHARAI